VETVVERHLKINVNYMMEIHRLFTRKLLHRIFLRTG